MSRIFDLLDSHPVDSELDLQKMSDCIEACLQCVGTCYICADACLSEDNPAELRDCIRSCTTNSEIAYVTAKIFNELTSADVKVVAAQLAACAESCRRCAENCEQHADHHEHCRICAEACRECESSCNAVIELLKV